MTAASKMPAFCICVWANISRDTYAPPSRVIAFSTSYVLTGIAVPARTAGWTSRPRVFERACLEDG
jgi:hypothetical protein